MYIIIVKYGFCQMKLYFVFLCLKSIKIICKIKLLVYNPYILIN